MQDFCERVLQQDTQPTGSPIPRCSTLVAMLDATATWHTSQVQSFDFTELLYEPTRADKSPVTDLRFDRAMGGPSSELAWWGDGCCIHDGKDVPDC